MQTAFERFVAKLLALVAVCCIMAFVANEDFVEALHQQSVYCEHVAAGEWPDFNGTYATECKTK